MPEKVIPITRPTGCDGRHISGFVTGQHNHDPLITKDLFPIAQKQDLLKPNEVIQGVLVPLKQEDEKVPNQLIQGEFTVERIVSTRDQITLYLKRIEDGRTRTWGPMKKTDWTPVIGEKLEIRTLRPTGPPTWTRTMLIDPKTNIGTLD